MGDFLPAVPPGAPSIATDSLGVCIICDERIATGEPRRFEIRRLATPLGVSRTIPTVHRPRWVHAECYQDDNALTCHKAPRP